MWVLGVTASSLTCWPVFWGSGPALWPVDSSVALSRLVLDSVYLYTVLMTFALFDLICLAPRVGHSGYWCVTSLPQCLFKLFPCHRCQVPGLGRAFFLFLSFLVLVIWDVIWNVWSVCLSLFVLSESECNHVLSTETLLRVCQCLAP